MTLLSKFLVISRANTEELVARSVIKRLLLVYLLVLLKMEKANVKQISQL